MRGSFACGIGDDTHRSGRSRICWLSGKTAKRMMACHWASFAQRTMISRTGRLGMVTVAEKKPCSLLSRSNASFGRVVWHVDCSASPCALICGTKAAAIAHGMHMLNSWGRSASSCCCGAGDSSCAPHSSHECVISGRAACGVSRLTGRQLWDDAGIGSGKSYCTDIVYQSHKE
jgi:hypothetical protein